MPRQLRDRPACHRSGCCWPHRAGTARASTARWSPWRRRSSGTGPRSTCASRSSTTSTSSTRCSRAVRSSSRRPTRFPKGRPWSSRHTASHRSSTEEAAARSLKTIDATCPLVTKVHREAVRFARDDYDILLIGHEGHEEVVGTSGEAPEHITLVDGPGRRRLGRRPRPAEGRLAVADHAVGRRDDGDGPQAAGALPGSAGPAERRHLLRHPEPPAGGQADRRRARPDARRRLAQLLQLGAPGRGRPRARCRGRPPRRRRDGDRRGLVRRRATPSV